MSSAPDIGELQRQARDVLDRTAREAEITREKLAENVRRRASPPPEPAPNGKANGHSGASEPNALRKLRGIDFADMQPHLADGYLIKQLAGPNTLVGIIGPTGSGKTFFAADLALHIAAGRPWRALAVRGGLVVYAALEGPVSAENRFVAARGGRAFDPSIPLRLTSGPINLRDPADVQLLIAFVQEAEAHFGEKCVAVFVDTLSRAMAGGDENGPEDMGALIGGADAVRLATGATVFLVHHLGKDESRGARGHSSLKAALDTEIEVCQKCELRLATVTKQRDLPSGLQFAFRLHAIELGRDQDGDAVTTCVVEPADVVATSRAEPTGRNGKLLLTALREWKREHATAEVVSSIDLREIAKSQGITKKSRLQEALEPLQRLGWLVPSVGGFRFHPEDTL